MFDKILPGLWMTLAPERREHLAHVFHVQRSGISEIRDSTHVSDGRTIDDLSVITAERMAEYVGSTESFSRLWELTVAKAHYELHPPVGEIRAPIATEEAELSTSEPNDEKPKKRSKASK